MATNFAETLVWKRENDVKLCRHKQRTPNDHHMTLNQNPPHENFLRTALLRKDLRNYGESGCG